MQQKSILSVVENKSGTYYNENIGLYANKLTLTDKPISMILWIYNGHLAGECFSSQL